MRLRQKWTQEKGRLPSLLVILSLLTIFLSEGVSTLDSGKNESAGSLLRDLTRANTSLIVAPLRNHLAEKKRQTYCDKLQEENELGHRICEVFHRSTLKYFTSLFIIIAWGALVRTFLRWFTINVPYTVVLMMSGLAFGFLSKHFCAELSPYTAIARTPPEVILFLFLPVLIFESAFSMNSHVFIRGAMQILLMALPGMLLATFATAFFSQYVLVDYKWTFSQASLFGSIISATDPVAVVAILRELGTSETLGVLIEGESLLNDGVAILLYEIFEKIVVAQESGGGGADALHIFLKFVQIAICGPIFGWIMAKIALFCLKRIFNDAIVEITITLVAAYLTFVIGEDFLGVSGIMATVVLGITMGSERTSISPEVDASVHHFWEMMAYLANTVLFVIVGIVISETAISAVGWKDFYYLGLLYLALNAIRLVMLIVLSPFLARLGFGLTLQNLLVMMWGGLRGAVGICLALEVYKHEHFCDDPTMGPKFLFQTAGIVLLTLLINGTTTKSVLSLLHVSDISMGRMLEMEGAVKQVTAAQNRSLAMLKQDRFLADANWKVVQKNTTISDPYKTHVDKVIKAAEGSIKGQQKNPMEQVQTNEAFVPDEDSKTEKVTIEHSMAGNEEYAEEIRVRVLRALKVSFWRQHESGILTDEATQILVQQTELSEDTVLGMIHARDIKAHLKQKGPYQFLRTQLQRFQEDTNKKPEKPGIGCLVPFWSAATSAWFEITMYCVVVTNMIPIIWEFLLEVEQKADKTILLAFFVINLVFTGIYLVEFLIKILGLGVKGYFKLKWNWIDFLILVESIAEIVVTYVFHDEDGSDSTAEALKYVRPLRLLRIVRIFRLLRPMLSWALIALDGMMNRHLFLGYDLSKGYITGVDDVIKFIPQIVSDPAVRADYHGLLEDERLAVIREMGILQKFRPAIATAVKTRQATRSVLNEMRDTLHGILVNGLIEGKESELLQTVLQKKMKRLWNSPATVNTATPEIMLSNVSWVLGNEDILSFVYKNAKLVNFGIGDVISRVGDKNNGIYIIVSGLVKVCFEPTTSMIQALKSKGLIPNSEAYHDPTFVQRNSDYLSSGAIIGELGVVTGDPVCSTIIAETSVLAYHIPKSAMQFALKEFNANFNSLESRIWRSVGTKIAVPLLCSSGSYLSWSSDKIRVLLENSAVPIGEEYDSMTVPGFVSEVILIYGQVADRKSKHIYTAPCCLPRNCTKLAPVEVEGDTPCHPKILIVVTDLDEHDDIESQAHDRWHFYLHQWLKYTSKTRHDNSPSTSTDNPIQRERRLSEAAQFGLKCRLEKALSSSSGEPSAATGMGRRLSSIMFDTGHPKRPSTIAVGSRRLSGPTLGNIPIIKSPVDESIKEDEP